MSLQNIINTATTINWNRARRTGVQYTRSGAPRASENPGLDPWTFEVSVAPQAWNNIRASLEAVVAAGSTQPWTITWGSNLNLSWIWQYRGAADVAQLSASQVLNFTGNQLTIGNLPGIAPGAALFVAGDLIQITGYPYPFTVVNTVLRGSGSQVTLTTHRPNIINSEIVGQTLKIGAACEFLMFVPRLPGWTMTPGATQRDASGVLVNNAIVEFDSAWQLSEWVGQA